MKRIQDIEDVLEKLGIPVSYTTDGIFPGADFTGSAHSERGIIYLQLSGNQGEKDKPYINLLAGVDPSKGTVTGIYRITDKGLMQVSTDLVESAKKDGSNFYLSPEIRNPDVLAALGMNTENRMTELHRSGYFPIEDCVVQSGAAPDTAPPTGPSRRRERTFFNPRTKTKNIGSSINTDPPYKITGIEDQTEFVFQEETDTYPLDEDHIRRRELETAIPDRFIEDKTQVVSDNDFRDFVDVVVLKSEHKVTDEIIAAEHPYKG